MLGWAERATTRSFDVWRNLIQSFPIRNPQAGIAPRHPDPFSNQIAWLARRRLPADATLRIGADCFFQAITVDGSSLGSERPNGRGLDFRGCRMCLRVAHRFRWRIEQWR